MENWVYAAQRLIDFIEENVCDCPSLAEISRQVGYSPYYCSEQFHRLSGMTIREYALKRRLAKASIDLRETGIPIVEIALKYGFSDQSAFSKAFKNLYGISPSQYRKCPCPLPLIYRKMLPKPFKNEGGTDMSISKPYVRVEYIPAHKYLGVYKPSETKEVKIWAGHDCDLACGIISSFKNSDTDVVVTRFSAGRSQENGRYNYFFGSGVPADYHGEIPEGFELRGEFPGSYYIVFCHQPSLTIFARTTRSSAPCTRLREALTPVRLGNGECQIYERHYPEALGYQLLRPVRRAEG